MVPNVFLLDVSNHGTHPQSIGKTSQAMAVWRWRPPEEEIEAKALLGLQQNRNRNETYPLLLPLWNPHGQKVWAGAFPMPLPPPVTTTTLSRKENRLLLGCVFMLCMPAVVVVFVVVVVAATILCQKPKTSLSSLVFPFLFP